MKAPRIIVAFMMLVVTALAFADINIYTSRKLPQIAPMLQQYTKETGVKINYIPGEEAALIARMQEDKKAGVVADIFWTQDGVSLDRAEQLGLLAPFKNAELNANIPAAYRSKNDAWFALSLRTRPIFYNSDLVKLSDLSTYEGLADPKFKNKLCVRTSRKIYTISLVASIVRNDGEAKARQVVQGWVNNFATAPFNDEQVILSAVDKGQCAVTIVNAHYYFQWLGNNPVNKVKLFFPNQKQAGAHVNITGAGVVAGAPNAKQAQDFLVWMSREKNQEAYSTAVLEFPINPKAEPDDLLEPYEHFKKDALLLGGAEAYQDTAIRILKEANYQ